MYPSGDPTPSAEDVNVTRQLTEAGKLVDVEIPGHIIIGASRFLSMKNQGHGFT